MISTSTSLGRVGIHSIKLVYLAFAFFRNAHADDTATTDAHIHTLARREIEKGSTEFIVFAALIPVLVLTSGLFAGLTLGYMSLDETQLQVLCISGTPEQKRYAQTILPIRSNGHLLLVTLLLANMIVNESLPVISEPILGGGVQSVIVSTTLIIIFSEIIPQSLFTRQGLYLGAKLAPFTKCLIYLLGIIAWPVAKLLDFVIGSQHGIIYRRAELKELIALHASVQEHGGDLKDNTVNIIGATLDLQGKVVTHAMTPISQVFMISINAKLDYDLLKEIVSSGHSRVPVYEELEIPSIELYGAHQPTKDAIHKVRKIVGILLVKQCVLLDPKDATSVRKMSLNKVPIVPKNESLLGILDRFQEGRSHMAIVSRISVEKAKSVKAAVKQSMTQRIREKIAGDTSSSSDSTSDSSTSDSSDSDGPISRFKKRKGVRKEIHGEGSVVQGEETEQEKLAKHRRRRYRRSKKKIPDVETGLVNNGDASGEPSKTEAAPASKVSMFSRPHISSKEQFMPADAVLGKESANELLESINPAIQPLGIITLEDILEELIGAEIYDEFDEAGAQGDPYVHPANHVTERPNPCTNSPTPSKKMPPLKMNFLRSRSAPSSPIMEAPSVPAPAHGPRAAVLTERLAFLPSLTTKGGHIGTRALGRRNTLSDVREESAKLAEIPAVVEPPESEKPQIPGEKELEEQEIKEPVTDGDEGDDES